MKFTVLTDEQIAEVIHNDLGSECKELTDYSWMVTDVDQSIAKAQLSHTLKQIKDWGNEKCPHWEKRIKNQILQERKLLKRECPICWEELDKEMVYNESIQK